VTDDLQNDTNEPTKTDTIASDACTRSGAFALALSLVLFALVTSWAHQSSEIALAHYLAYRYDLALSIERLGEDPVWQRFADSNRSMVSKSLSQLPTQVPETSSGSAVILKKIPGKDVVTAKPFSPGWRPAPPTVLTATVYVEVPELREIVNALKKLNDSNLLTKSRRYSNFFDFSIVRWAQRREDLIYRNSVVNVCAKKEIETPHKSHIPEDFVPALDTDVMLGCLNLGNVKDLAQFEQPVMTNPDQIGGQIARDIEIVPGTLPLPRDTYTASLISQTLLFFVLVYFGAYAKEAMRSEKFPVQGTLFSAFSRSRWTRLVMFFALCIPYAASLSVAIESGRWLLWAGSILILVTVCSIFVMLQRNSYWWTASSPR